MIAFVLDESAVQKSGFPITSQVISTNFPDSPGPSRTAVYIMQLKKVDCVILGGVDIELIDLALRLGRPVFATHRTKDYEVGLRWGWENDF